ncbi:MAG TPA: MarR family transcriptional regulator [Anaeromyxobacteraceae bacterium]|nr:MarR family transcriptional regulator [Anaeromyxobacteraceae bacterium]
MKTMRKDSQVIEVMEDIWALTHALEARSKWMMRTYDVSGPQLLLIRIVGVNSGCSPSQAARHLRLHAGTVTRLVAGLERAGVMRRSAHDRDGRKVRLTLTRRGRRLARLSVGTVHRAVGRTLAGAGHGEVACAKSFMRRLAAELMPA